MKPRVEVQDHNGVRVRVHRDKNGSWVEADCKCFGSHERAHSTDRCPVFLGVQAADEPQEGPLDPDV